MLTALRSPSSPAKQLAGFIAKYSPAMAREIRAALARMGQILPASAVRMVYDNWNGLVVGVGPNERPSDAIVSIFAAPAGRRGSSSRFRRSSVPGERHYDRARNAD